MKKPSPPKLESKANYGLVNITQCLSFEDLLAKINPISSAKPLQMELINLNGKNYGQNFGFINYRAKVSKFKQLKFEKFPNDRTIVMVDGNFVKLIDFRDQDFIKNHMTVNASDTVFHSNGSQHTLDILVENMGREDHAGGKSPLNHRKGINGKIFIDNHDLTNWKIYPLEFKKDFVKNLSDAHWKSCKSNLVPSIHKGTLIIKDKPKDTFLKFDHWTKGNIFVNGFNVGRYWNVGPQKTLYIPWPLLNTGNNHVYLFEIEKGFKTIQFTDKPNLG